MPRRGFRTRVRSRHDTHNILRTELERLPFRAVVRLGSTTVVDVPGIVECNTPAAVRISANKRLMKEKFTDAGVKTADWWNYNDRDIAQLSYPIVAKHVHGSRGRGNYLIHNAQELRDWIRGKEVNSYIFEKFYNYSREYRLHVTEDGCFYTCRKVRRNGIPDNQRWFFNDSNSNWILESNDLFDRPVNFQAIIDECVKALKATGLDIAAFDVRVQSAVDNEGMRRVDPKFIILESNSAPSFGEVTAQKYLQEIPKVLRRKYGRNI